VQGRIKDERSLPIKADMSNGPKQRQVALEAEIENAVAREARAKVALEQAEAILDAAYEELGSIIDQDPRFIRAQEKFERINAEAARRKQPIDDRDLCRSIAALADRFGPIGRESSKRDDILSPLSDELLGQLGRSAYRSLGSIRNLIAATEVAPWIESVKAAEAEVRASAGVLYELRAELTKLRFESKPAQNGASLAGNAIPSGAVVPARHPNVERACTEAARIEQVVRKRGITTLVHFTRVDNLCGIARNGLIPRSELEANSRNRVEFNDSLRLERRTHHSCLSITKINYRMFWRYKYRFPEVEWCILELEPEVLWSQRCLFCRTNAASSGTVAQAESYGWTAKGLDQMFHDPVDTPHGRHARCALAGGLRENQTSDPQAEVLVQGRIDPRLIRTVVVPSLVGVEEVNRQLAATPIGATANAGAFAKRPDYALWQPETQG
jgi:hypothetical protein